MLSNYKLPRTESPRFSLKSLQEQQKTLPDSITGLSAEDCNRIWAFIPALRKRGFLHCDYKFDIFLLYIYNPSYMSHVSHAPEFKAEERSNEPDQKDFRQPTNHNRYDRRWQARIQSGLMSGPQKLAIEIGGVYKEYLQEARQWNRIREDTHDPYGVALLYDPQDGKTVVNMAERLRELSVLFNQASNPGKVPKIRVPKDKDVYTYPVKGISLAEIEKMPTPLSLDDIRRINRFFHRNKLTDLFLSNQANMAQNIAVRLPIVPLANPEIKLPYTLKNLNNALTDYFDYFTVFLNYPNAVDDTQLSIVISAILDSGFSLFQGLGVFMPARLGITPASMLRLFEEQSLYSPAGFAFAWNMVRKRMEPLVKSAYRKDGLPPKCSQWQHYDERTEKKVSQYLLKHVQQETNSDGLDENRGDGLLADMNRSISTLRKAALETKDKFVRIPLEHPLFEAITLAPQFHYKQSFIIAGDLRGEPLSLVLEVNGDDRLHGIPVDLLKENPHSGGIFIRDLFPPVLDLAYQINPRLKPQQSTIVLKPAAAEVTRPPSEEEIAAAPEINMELKQPKAPKRRTFGIFPQPQVLPPRPSLTEPQLRFRVSHTRSQVIELMGERVPDKTINRVMTAIHRFELGYINKAKILEISHKFTRLKTSDDLRILLRKNDNGQYTVYDILNRNIAYRNLT